MAATIIVLPVRPGRTEEVRAFVRELMGVRRTELAESHRRRGVTRQVWFLGHQAGQDVVSVFTESSDPERAYGAVAASDHPFDRWLAGRLGELFEDRVMVESLADTAPRPGPWRGWRRLGR